MKRKKLTLDEIVNYWLEKYHGITVAQVREEHPDWTERNPMYSSRIFYETYPCTEEQHDEWREWLVKALMKETRMGRKYVEKGIWGIYLDTAPMIKPAKV